MEKRISSGNQIQSKVGVSIGYTDRCPTKSYLDGYSDKLFVQGTYKENQLVAIEDISAPLTLSFINISYSGDYKKGNVTCTIETNDPNGWTAVRQQSSGRYVVEIMNLTHQDGYPSKITGHNGDKVQFNYYNGVAINQSFTVEFVLNSSGETVSKTFWPG